MSEDKASTTPDESTVRVSPIKRWLHRVGYQIRWHAHWLFPNTIRGPGRRPRLFGSFDDRDNENTRVPEDEELRLRAIWAVELFGPAEIESLLISLTRLGWRAGFGRERGEAVEWVRRQRSYGVGGWYNIGLVTRRAEQSRFVLAGNHAALPDEVDYLMVQMFHPTPSLTCVVIGFAFREDFQRIYERQLNQARKTVYERLTEPRRIAIVDPWALKERAIAEARVAAQLLAKSWIAKNLPGFYSGISPSPMPTAELVTTVKDHLFLPRTRTSSAQSDEAEKWRRIVLNSSPVDAWKAGDCEGFRFQIQRDLVDDGGSHLVVQLCTSQVAETALSTLGGHTNCAYIQYCNDRIGGLLTNWSTVAFLMEISKGIKSYRSALAIESISRREAVRTIEQIQSFFDRSLGTPAVVGELRDRAACVADFRHWSGDYFSMSDFDAGKQASFANVICTESQSRATRVVAQEQALREHFVQLSSILSIRESVQAQKRMERLTVITLAVALLSLFVAVSPTKEWRLPVVFEKWQTHFQGADASK
ncbi:hypothetical protein [Achromobacter piechaudii]|uniref:Uncharacterized protein n=1 Tax=Achromobacter piechaudii TaxID=72556 RepID=A0ABN7F309_9BURK|nr:hypothetical protein [Achromobacter piechaudii]CAB3721740.1 hypothetical protein LMG1873_03967 [Achromobacter piechaudii]CAB3892291.1 hypothetical protein LMG2828_04051 [Achromobacter piechaudii]CAB3957678.1 hypothetical protein LMG6103_05310 [Achromobacter piechaudii]